jgi:V/A-type H+-transporting ATPase subunit F
MTSEATMAAAPRARGGAGSRYRLKVVTRPGASLGFRLAGVPAEEVDESRAGERLAALLAEPDLGLLAVDEDLLKLAPQRLLATIGRKGVPVVLPFAVPGRWTEKPGGEPYVAELIRRAIGYHIKIEV